MTMGYLARALVQVLAVHLVVSTALSLLVAVAWTRLAAAPEASPASHAHRWFLLRLLPSAGGLAAAMLTLVGYFLWEARAGAEAVGPVALACAVGGLLLLVAGAGRMGGAWWDTWRIERRLRVLAEGRLLAPVPGFVIDSRFPIVALVGLIVTRLFVARRVIEACSDEEFGAILAHEIAHARQHDNLRRLAMAGAPDLLALLPVAGRLDAAWLHASELAADDAASRQTAGVPLASALVKVARLATGPAGPMPASALYRGEPIAERVHRLLAPPPLPAVRRRSATVRTAILAAAVAVALAVMPLLYFAVEELLALGR